MPSKKLVTVRDYNFSDATLAQLADSMKSNITRDLAALAERNITPATIAQLDAMIDVFKDYPTDEEAKGDVGIAVETKEVAIGNALTKARMLRTAALNVFGEGSSKYSRFGFERMDKINDDKLPRSLRSMWRVGTKLQPLLAAEGIDAVFLTSFKTAIDAIVTALDNVDIAEENRDEQTEARIATGDTLYKEVVRLGNIGKDVFATISEALYNDYLIESFVKR